MMTIYQELFAITLLFSSYRAQYLPGMATDVPELSTFFKLINSTSDLYNRIQQGVVTVLAPTNDAMANAGLTNNHSISTSQLEAILNYHILHGYHSSASFSSPMAFFPSLLEDSEYTNKSGGQVVGSTKVDGTSTVVSALWSESKIVTADIFSSNGLLHSIDKVLTMPEQAAQTITSANLTDYVALGAHTRLTTSKFLSLLVSQEVWPDLIIFACNSPEYSADFTGWDDLSLQQQLEAWKYHIVNGLNLTSWVIDGEIYINDAKITQPDLLHANGVMQILDKPLNPDNVNARPVSRSGSGNAPSTDSHKSMGLSTGAKAGVGVGVTLGGIALIAAAVYFIFERRRKRRNAEGLEPPQYNKSELAAPDTAANPISPQQSVNTENAANEMLTKSNTWEIGGSTEKRGLPADSNILESEGDEKYRRGLK